MSAETSPSVVVMGEALVHLIAPAGEGLGEGAAARVEVGGAAVLVARALARRGRGVALAAHVGADPWGDALVRAVAGVDVSRVVRRGSTGLLVIAPGPPRSVRPVRDLDAEAEVSAGALDGVRHLHLASVLPGARFAEVAAAGFARARDAGAVVSVCLNARPRLFAGAGGAWAALAPALDGAAWVQASEEDLAVLQLDVPALRGALPETPWLVITRGGAGATLVGRDGERHVPPVPGVTLPDPMGAGDALSAALVGRLVPGASLDQAAEALARAQREAFAGACEGDERAASMRPC